MLPRDPSSVPTPVVIALERLCGRAARPASEEEVRGALARLPAERDIEVLAFCQGDPPLVPLSPHGAVDLIAGSSRELVARREEDGSYDELARRIATQGRRAEVGPAGSGAAPAAAPAAAAEPSKPTRRKRGSKATPAPVPLRRPRAEVEARRSKEAEARARAEETPAPPPPRPGRRPAAPQLGRYVGGPAARRPFEELEGAEGRAILDELIRDLRANGRALLTRLNTTWAGPNERNIDEALLQRLLRDHGLEPLFQRVERENLRELLRRTGGFEGPLRRMLGLTPAALSQRIARYGLREELRALRERTKEQALAVEELEPRLRLVVRDAGKLRAARVLDEIHERNREELEEELEESLTGDEGLSPPVLCELCRRRLGVDPKLWAKVVEIYELEARAARLLARRAPRSS